MNKLNTESIYVKRKKIPDFNTHWHCHNEYELRLILKGEGVRIIGDNIDCFRGPELVFLGENLPHLYKNDESNEASQVDYISVKFKNTIENETLFSLPEFAQIRHFLKTSERGFVFSNATIKKVKNQFITLTESSPINRILIFINILNTLSEETEPKLLASQGFSKKNSIKGEKRIQGVITYISENYSKDIELETLAEVSHMTTNSFCRYFKNRTGKTAFQFIREYRVNKACQMLLNSEKSISEICYDSGFNSVSSFNRIFRDIKNCSANKYKNANSLQL